MTDTTDYEEALTTKSYVQLTYTLLIAGSVILHILQALNFYQFAMSASISLHNKVFRKVIRATMEFFDMNLTGNILNRFAKDVGIIDELLPLSLIIALIVS